MAEIKIISDGLEQNRKEIENKIQELKDLNHHLSGLLNKIDETWEGQSSRQYLTAMTSYKQKAEEMIGVLSEFKYYIEQAKNQFEDKDRSGGIRIRNI